MIRLKFERLNRRISQDDLAFVSKVPQPIISLIETGTWNPKPAQLAALAEAPRLDPDLLLDEVEVAR